jgi:hypothetical protein
MLALERLAIDDPGEGRTSFLSHVGAQPRLTPGAWIGHRDLLYALALANLSPTQRTSLARAVVVEHGHEFGVGHLVLRSAASGLPLGGSLLSLEPRNKGPRCLYAWALGERAEPQPCDWLLLRVQPHWAVEAPAKVVSAGGLAKLAALGGDVLVLVASAVGARQVSDACAHELGLAAHPRFAPHLEGLRPEAPVLLWPHDAIASAGLRRRQIAAVVLVGAPERVRRDVERWAEDQDRTVVLCEATCPGRADRSRLEAFWNACGRPRVLLRGDPTWAKSGETWLVELGAEVQVQGEVMQMPLF